MKDFEYQELIAGKAQVEKILADGGDASVYEVALRRYEAELADAAPEPDRSHSLTARPKAGAAARNQYGTFQVRYATQPQTNYIKMLMDRRDLSQIDPKKLDVAELRAQVASYQVNKKAASAIIDLLLEQPEKVAAPTGAPATPRQIQFVRNLLAEREGNEKIELIRLMLNVARESNALTAQVVSNAITELLALPVNRTTVPDGNYALPTQDGHYAFYRINSPTEGKWAGYTFVVQLVGSVGDWSEQRLSKNVQADIVRRVAADVTEAARMFGLKAKACSFCSSPLSNVQSRAAGYGETCADNHGLPYPSRAEALDILAERGESE